MKICVKCGAQLPDGNRFCTVCGATCDVTDTLQNKTSVGMDFDFDSNTVQVSKKTSYEYKVLSQKDKWFSGKFDPLKLEEALNAYAEQGWRVIGCATADFPSFGGPRQELIALLEREK